MGNCRTERSSLLGLGLWYPSFHSQVLVNQSASIGLYSARTNIDMLAFLIAGLLLSAVPNIRTQPSLNEILDTPPPTGNPLSWARQHSNTDEMLPFERLNPRFWLGPEYRQALRQIAQMREEDPLIYNNGLNVYRAADGFIAQGSNAMDRTDIGVRDVGVRLSPARERLQVANPDAQSNIGKRDSYLSMCHFKLCNLGRKRRISQGGQTDLVTSDLNAEK